MFWVFDEGKAAEPIAGIGPGPFSAAAFRLLSERYESAFEDDLDPEAPAGETRFRREGGQPVAGSVERSGIYRKVQRLPAGEPYLDVHPGTGEVVPLSSMPEPSPPAPLPEGEGGGAERDAKGEGS